MADFDWNDPKARMAHARAQRIVGRTRVLPPMGEQPKIKGATPAERPAETPNLMLATGGEPFSFPLPPRPHNYDPALEPRLVVEAEIEELMEWGLPRYQEVYPRCTYDSIRPWLGLACRGGRLRFVRTDNAVGLFVAETTPEEPLLFVYQWIVVRRSSTGDQSKEAYRIIRAGERWGISIGAIGFQFGRGRCCLSLRDDKDFLRRLSRIVPDNVTELYTKVLRKPVDEDTAPGARMRAMGIPQPAEA